MTVKCEFCPNVATLQCDGRLSDRRCDRYICEKCAKCVSRIHLRLTRRDKRTGSRSAYLTTDLCPECVRVGRDAGYFEVQREPTQPRLF
jgi:hypothetical protein